MTSSVTTLFQNLHNAVQTAKTSGAHSLGPVRVGNDSFMYIRPPSAKGTEVAKVIIYPRTTGTPNTFVTLHTNGQINVAIKSNAPLARYFENEYGLATKQLETLSAELQRLLEQGLEALLRLVIH